MILPFKSCSSLMFPPPASISYFKEEVGSGVIISEPFQTPRGTKAILRFSEIEAGENWKLIRHEVSHDDGESWREFRRQRMDKVE
jgi:hypothetical protein